MAVYKLFPLSDSTIYSYLPNTNSGIDAILEVHNDNVIGDPAVARSLIKFDQEEIDDLYNNTINTSSFDVYLNQYAATVYGLNDSINLEIYPIAQNWDNGTGRRGDNPTTTNGVTWNYRTYPITSSWSAGGTDLNGNIFTSSYNSSYTGQGGGNWYTQNSSSISLLVTQSFNFRSNKDISAKVTPIINEWISGSFDNNGFIIKLSSSIEFVNNLDYTPTLKYYSVDTNTIYPPHLEFRWDDYQTVLNTSLSSSIVTSPKLKLSIENNRGEYYQEDVNRFRVNVSPLYPTRVYQTSSLYTNLNFLPTSSYYAVKDLDTNEFVIIFDEQYTKISSDSEGNYFDLYMNGLEPERYYEILIRTNIGSSTQTFRDEFYFKVING